LDNRLFFTVNYLRVLNAIRLFGCCILLLIAIGSCNNNANKNVFDNDVPIATVPNINYAVKASYAHDTSLFTEGFLVHDGKLFESTGSPEDLPWLKSMIGTYDLQTGKFDKKIGIDKKYFGEGIVFLHNKLYELTYKNKIGFIYNATTFKRIDSFTYKNTEGWSLTTNGRDIIMDDGTDVLTYLDPVKLKPTKYLKVTENGLPRDSLNELEFIKGYIYANIWQNNSIVKIDTTTGKVVGKLDLSSLMYEAKNKNPRADVLNGIAYDSATDKIYVTGKMWPTVYELEFSH